MKGLLCAILVFALVYGFFYFGGEICMDDGSPKIKFDADWKHIGSTIGKGIGEFVSGFIESFKGEDDSDATDLANPTEPGVPPEPDKPTEPATTVPPTELPGSNLATDAAATVPTEPTLSATAY